MELNSAGASTLKVGVLTTVSVDALFRGQYQPRGEPSEPELAELAESVKVHGVMQPPLVRPCGSQYEIICGERRWRAARLAGLAAIPVLVRELSDQQSAELAVIENVQRQDLNMIEEAAAYRRLHMEFSMSHSKIAERVGKNRATISQLIALLSLDTEVLNILSAGEMSFSQARLLCTAGLSAQHQTSLAQDIVSNGLTIKQIQSRIKAILSPREALPTLDKPASVDLLRLERDLSAACGSPVKILEGKGQRGVLQIEYSDYDVLDGLITRLVGDIYRDG